MFLLFWDICIKNSKTFHKNCLQSFQSIVPATFSGLFLINHAHVLEREERTYLYSRIGISVKIFAGPNFRTTTSFLIFPEIKNVFFMVVFYLFKSFMPLWLARTKSIQRIWAWASHWQARLTAYLRWFLRNRFVTTKVLLISSVVFNTT